MDAVPRKKACTRCPELGREQGPPPILWTSHEYHKRFEERKLICITCFREIYVDIEGSDNSCCPEDIADAPVKAEYLKEWKKIEKKDLIAEVKVAVEDGDKEGESKKRAASVATVATMSSKSKRAQKRERQEAQKSTSELCARFARGECSFGDKCKFNHDVDAFLAQKPEDLPGTCPYLRREGGKCPFGMGCRYAGSHEGAQEEPPEPAAYAAGAPAATLPLRDTSPFAEETNRMSKGLQGDLRKSTFDFSSSDAVLKAMGIQVHHQRGGGAPGGGGNKKGGKGPGMCYAFKKGNCKYGDSCKFSHGDPSPAEGAGEEASGGVSKDQGGEYKETVAPPREKKIIDFRGKTYLAPLTTVGNLPFRRVCKALGCDITIGEMALCTNLLQGQSSEWALLRRHPSEDLFGVQICGGHADAVARTCDIINREMDVDFVDINMGCPIDLICNKGAGSSLLQKPKRIQEVVRAASSVLTSCPLTFKIRTGYHDKVEERVAHTIVPHAKEWGACAVTLHGRSRAQRYTRLADWKYVQECGEIAKAAGVPLVGNGDVYNFTDYNAHVAAGGVATCMVARGALIKPWLFTEIKEQRHWDISAGERLDFLRAFCRFGLEHWGSDGKGVETTRRFLLEWMSFLYRYIPAGLMEVLPQHMHWRPPAHYARNDLEQLLGSDNAVDWVKLSTMLLGPPPANFAFAPKHKSNAYADTEAAQAAQVEG